ncbi:hypothetical protein CPB86DRAFT_804645 [Serendipita vermifera]|nr:hypothetical protein CPB86DRAFT_804645 [Serendipita vermifera]
MLLVFLLYHFAIASALPLGDESIKRLSPRSPNSCNDINDCRKLIDIIWSCVTTLLACTWLTLHPNIPPPFSKKIFLRYKLPPFIVTLMAPEWTLAWAMQQWSIANLIAREEGRGWTRTHGFFVLMGGFHAFTREDAAKPSQGSNHGTPWYPLDQHTVITLVKEGKIELPLEEEIQDKGKTDWLGKTLVLLQTGWFIIQCAARGAAHLPLSELEVVTLAYTIVNVGIYIAWWDKPRDVDRPIRVFMSKETVQQERQKATRRDPRIHSVKDIVVLVYQSAFPGSDARMNSVTFLAGQTGVPTFYPGRHGDANWIPSIFVPPAIGAIFGAVHCITWSYSFSSHTEQSLWRLSSAVMIGAPAVIFLFLALMRILIPFLGSLCKKKGLKTVEMILSVVADLEFRLEVIFCFLGPFMYGAARVCTFVLAFKTLASLPHGALRTIPWTKWIPHI